ncbi:metalloregulator ArsR/SmtB family transcription factor [Blastochloris viridis]|uniref:Arsenical resistance operon repressor n=1 Tax=Blastochloris viridis TaxID=1079 RepID=A0A0H5BE61_BLAVI|nr:metalloregulator ArsR/SmtB family transcription factor [Blastochloris viridis]ALK09622.1 HTH-type transcriptional repressor AseR [Blastochloris viridis]BAS00488.1 arsenical resistance operon repressor [Blastochloris viridis]CUU42285.1 HTH-type transcriptional repressor AseR [Blastochloris viridis]
MITPVELMSALADATRLAALRMVWDGQEHCVCELMKALGATQSRMSRHMAVLKVAGLVVDRRDAQWVRYRRNPRLDSRVVAVIEAVLALPANQRRDAA